MGFQILCQHLAKIFFGRSGGRAIVVCKIEMDDTAIKGTPDHGTLRFKNVNTTKILPKAKRDLRQHQAAFARTVIGCIVVSRGIGIPAFFH